MLTADKYTLHGCLQAGLAQHGFGSTDKKGVFLSAICVGAVGRLCRNRCSMCTGSTERMDVSPRRAFQRRSLTPSTRDHGFDLDLNNSHATRCGLKLNEGGLVEQSIQNHRRTQHEAGSFNDVSLLVSSYRLHRGPRARNTQIWCR